VSSITRYDIGPYSSGMDVIEDGEWTLYDDHISEVKALQEEIALLKSKLNFDWNSIK
jgi:hypothetical protein